MTFTDPDPTDFFRDRWGRPLIFPDDGTDKPEAFTRSSTAAKTVEDHYNLERHFRRSEAWGMAHNPALTARILALGGDPSTWDMPTKHLVDGIVEDALAVAQSNRAADIGTALHRLTERHDRGEAVIAGPYAADLEAYTEAMIAAGYEIDRRYIECRMVCDQLKMAGTADRIVTRISDRMQLIADIKGLALDTVLPTPTGWTTIGAVNVGDRVIGSDGRPCTVTAKSATRWKRCRRIVFDDGTAVIADDEHRWLVDVWGQGERVMTTAEIADRLDRLARRGGQRDIRVLNAAPLELDEADLPVDPYVLGCWLGDGSRGNGVICKPREVGMWAEIERRGYALGVEQIDKRTGCCTRSVRGLVTTLRDLGVLNNKHIPAAYLRASRQQRLDLLRGMMDTDGTTNKARRRRAVFGSVDKALALAVYELVVSLGERAHLSETTQTGFGLTVTAHNVEWAPSVANPFATEPKRARADVRDTGFNGRRLIVSAEIVPTIPTQCIAVDSPDHTYLCTESMIPTHNTGATVDYGALGWSAQEAAYAHSLLYDVASGKRLPTPAIDKTTGLIIHLPAGQGQCTIYEIDLVAGYRAATLANEIRAIRNEAKRWIRPVTVIAPEAGSVARHPSNGPRRDALLARYKKLTGPQRVQYRAAGVNGDDLDAVEAVLDQLAPVDVRAAAEHLATHPDEGGERFEGWDEVEAAFNALPPAIQGWFRTVVGDSRRAGVAFHAHHDRTVRRFHLYRGVIAAASTFQEPDDDLDEVIRQMAAEIVGPSALWPTITLGHAVGSMDAVGAERFAALVAPEVTA